MMKRLFSLLFVCLAAQLSAAPGTIPLSRTKGAKLYAQSCASCHMADGTGIPGVQPGITDSSLAAGDPTKLIQLFLRGPAAVLPASRPHYNTGMPTFAKWSDANIAAVATYVRKKFGHDAPPVTPAQVAALRAK